MPLDPLSSATRTPPAEPGGPADVTWSGFRPLYALEGRSPQARRDAHAANVALRRLDLADFEAFLRRHVDGARRCATLADLAAHGRPRLPALPWEQGATPGENRDCALVNQRFVKAAADALAEIGEVRARLEGRRPPLDVRLDAAVAIEARLARARLGVEASLPDRTATATAGARTAQARCAADRDGEVRCGRAAPGATFSRGRVETLEARVGAAYGRVAGGAVAVGVAAGTRIGGEGASLRAEVKLGIDVQLLDAEIVRRALSREDRWVTPAPAAAAPPTPPPASNSTSTPGTKDRP